MIGRSKGVGIVEIYGTIGSGSQITEQMKLLSDANFNKRVQAVLLDIDSPGGTVGGSEALYYMLLRVAKKKPVVAYIRGMGASGAYLLCCTASKIISCRRRWSAPSAFSTCVPPFKICCRRRAWA